MSFDSTIHAKAVELTKLSYEITAVAGSGHPSSAASLSHLIAILMYQHMRYEPSNPGHRTSDRLVLSEGHAVPIVYAACADQGVAFGKGDNLRPMTREDAKTLRELDSAVDGHPNPIEGFPFFDTATGSLGQGLSSAAGLALAARMDGMDKRVFCIIGDGESREGQVWEAVDFLRDHDLRAVLPIFNCNVFAQTQEVSPQQSWQVTAKKLEAAGFNALVVNGHQPGEVLAAFEQHVAAQADASLPPVALVAQTEKGWGADSQKGNGHHGTAVTGEALQGVLDELDQTATAMGAIAMATLRVGQMSPPPDRARPEPKTPLGFEQAMNTFGQEQALASGKFATRKAYGVALRALGHAKPNLVALDADVNNSTFSGQFLKDEKLKDRFVECRIAEQNMFSVAAGLAAAGKTPFCSTFAKFVTRGYDQIEMAINSGCQLKIAGSHAGISLGPDGPSQMALPDVAWFSSFATMTHNTTGKPGFYVLTPSDAYSAYALTTLAAEHDGSVYLRTLRPETEFLYSADDTFKLGGHEVLMEGSDLLIVASGYMVHEVNKALEKLDDMNIEPTIVDLYSLPYDEDAILDLANACNGMVLTVEDNYGNGIGAHIASTVAASGDGFTVDQMYVKKIPKSAKDPDQMLRHCGLHADDIAAKAIAMMDAMPV